MMIPPAPTPRPPIVRWLACDLRTGRVADELPSLTPTQPIGRQLGTYTSASFSLALPGAPADWQAATDPGRVMIVAIADDLPVWAGMVLTRTGGSSDTVEIGCATPEAYFDRRFVRDHQWSQVDEASVIAAGLIGDAQIDGIGLTIDAPPTGTLRDRTYHDGDDSTVLARLQELMGVQNGPEFTVDVRWRPGAEQSAVELVARVRKRIGVITDRPTAVFTFPGDVIEYTLAESYESGKGANVVRAMGEGEGEDRRRSADMIATELLAAGWPRYEHRFTPSTSITSQATLDSHARAALATMRAGVQVWRLQSVASRAPRLGHDWALGDTIGLHVERSPRHPDGAMVTARALAWEWDVTADRIVPIIAEGD